MAKGSARGIGARKLGVALTAACFGLVGCAEPGSQPGAEAPATSQVAPQAAATPAPTPAAATAPASLSATPTPQNTYTVTRVTPVIPTGADLSWFAPTGGSPRVVGAYVGSAVIDGISSVFTGDKPLALELRIRRFRPVPEREAAAAGGTHRIMTEFVLLDETTGQRITVSEEQMDLIAIGGVAGQIARNAGRTPEVRVAERISNVASAWAARLSCNQVECPAPIVVAAPAPAPAPEPQAAPAPVQAAAGALTAAAGALAALGAQAAEAVTPDPEPAPEPVPEPTPAPEPTPEPAPEPAPAPQAAPEPAPAPAPAPIVAEGEPESDQTVSNFFGALFGQPDEDEDAAQPEQEVAAAEPAPQPAPEPQPAPAPEPQPTAAPEPAPAPAAPAPQPAPQPRAEPAPQPAPQPAPAAEPRQAGSPFFRSPVSEPPVLPQTALLGRQQRANDPLRRQKGDTVLEINNLPAYWDGDSTTGGIWVALPYAPAYRRAVVSNPANGRTIEANLFWRDPQSGGGSTLLSSAAAEALGVAPGQVANLGVKVIAAD